MNKPFVQKVSKQSLNGEIFTFFCWYGYNKTYPVVKDDPRLLTTTESKYVV